LLDQEEEQEEELKEFADGHRHKAKIRIKESN